MKRACVQDQAFNDFSYAKTHGRIGVGPGRVTFRFYYNPRADDRRLAFAPGRNLLRPSGPGEPADAFETQEP
jgi:hypothetical protein